MLVGVDVYASVWLCGCSWRLPSGVLFDRLWRGGGLLLRDALQQQRGMWGCQVLAGSLVICQ